MRHTMINLHELYEKLIEQIGEEDLVDVLELTTEDLVNAFKDKIEDNYETLLEMLDLAEEDDNE